MGLLTLTDEQVEQIKAWCQRQGGGPCPHCGQNSWAIGELIYAMALFPKVIYERVEQVPQLESELRKIISPLAQVICVQCGFVKLFAAKTIGIYGQDE